MLLQFMSKCDFFFSIKVNLCGSKREAGQGLMYVCVCVSADDSSSSDVTKGRADSAAPCEEPTVTI